MENQTSNDTPLNEQPLDAPEMDMADLLREHDMTIDLPQRGEIREGTIVSISDDMILVDVGAKSEGVVTGRELDEIDKETRDTYRVGDQLMVYIVNPDDNSQVMLSIAKAQEEQNWKDAEQLMKSQKVLEGSISGYNKGGLIMRVGQLRGFIPASQISSLRHPDLDESKPPEQRYQKLVKSATAVRVIEVDRRRNRLILSEKATDRELREVSREYVFDQLQPGDTRRGRVRSVTNFGAFVDLGGADGLVHLSEMSWQRIKHPSEVVKEGDMVEVVVLSVDRDRRRIALSMKQAAGDPWEELVRNLREGQLVEGQITKLENFGAFASIRNYEGVEGLVHISELSENRIAHPKAVVSVGKTLTLRVIRIDKDKRRIGLSLKEVSSPRYIEQDMEYYQAREFTTEGQAGEKPDVSTEDPLDAALFAEMAAEVAASDSEATVEMTVAAEPETPTEAERATESAEEAPTAEVTAETEVPTDEDSGAAEETVKGDSAA